MEYKLSHTITAIIVGVLAASLVFVLTQLSSQEARGSVSQGSEYNATSTAQNAVYGAITGDRVIKRSWGVLGSVVVTGANTGAVNIYNATTSNVNLRAASKASTTVFVASLPANLAAGTYTFDTVFTDGLLIDLVSGNMPTTTITYR